MAKKDKKLTVVITSTKAKQHIASARQLMNEMNESINIHKQNLERNRIKTNSERKEIEKSEMQNKHELSLQQQKLNAVNALI